MDLQTTNLRAELAERLRFETLIADLSICRRAVRQD